MFRRKKKLTPYDLIGKEKGIRDLVDKFYDNMEQMPEAKDIRDMHKEDLGLMREKLFMFLSGWFGGPNLYWEKYGHPMMRKRHLPFPIGFKERDQWLLCMRKAMDELNLPTDFDAYLYESFQGFAEHMRNC